MSRSTTPADQPPPGDAGQPPRPARVHLPLVALAVTAVALLSLAAIPLMLERQLASLETHVSEVADPARLATREIQLLLALETAGTRGYLLTGDSGYAAKHQAARRRRKAEVARLVELTASSGAEVRSLATQLARELEGPDRLLDSLYGGRIPPATFVTRMPLQQARLEAVTRTNREIGVALSEETAERLGSLHANGVWAAALTLLLSALAVIASLLVIRLGLAYRTLAIREARAHHESDAARAEAERRREQIERMAEARARFVRGFTHDVKNPLNAAAANLALLEEGLGDPVEGAARVRRGILSAVGIIDDMLMLARAEAGELAIQRAPVNLNEVACELAHEFRPAAERRGLTLECSVPPQPMLAFSDRQRVHQVLANLVTNAVNYTSEGGVSVRVCADEDLAGAAPRVRVEVTDTGPGLDEEDQRVIFEEFRRLNTAEGTRGSGLGLAISKRVAEALGGDIVLTSERGKGCCFALVLPRDAGVAATAAGA